MAAVQCLLPGTRRACTRGEQAAQYGAALKTLTRSSHERRISIRLGNRLFRSLEHASGSERERASFEPSPAEYSEGSNRSNLTLTEPYELLHVQTRFDTQVMGRIA